MPGDPAAKPKLLIVSYQFPPAGGIAVQRALSFARYLPPAGVDVQVLSAANPGVPTIDPGLVRRIPPDVAVHRTFSPEPSFAMRQKLWTLLSGGDARGSKPQGEASSPSPPPPPSLFASLKSGLSGALRSVFCPDPEIVWVPFATRRGRKVVAGQGIDVVLVTTPPFSSLLVGTRLKARFPHLKLIADFRDEWLDFYLSTFDYYKKSSSMYRRSAAIERAAIEASDLVVSTTISTSNRIRNRYPEQPDSKFVCVPNGYDAELFGEFAPRRHGGPKVIVTHVGTAYKASTPRFYLDALDRLEETTRNSFETRFIGRVTAEEALLFENRRSSIRQLGFMPQQQALKEMEETDCLLVTMTDPISVPGKLLEYLATGKPVLAITPEGSEVDRLMKETGAGWCVDPNRPGAVESTLVRIHEAVRTNMPFTPNRAAIERYNRPQLAAELARHIQDICADSSSTHRHT